MRLQTRLRHQLCNHLFSKLNLAKHALNEFHANSKGIFQRTSAFFGCVPRRGAFHFRGRWGDSLYGLIQGFDTEFVDDDSGTFWNKRPIIGRSFGK